MGVAGTGKSTLSHELLRRIQAVYLDNNHIADAFFPDTRNGRNYERLRPSFYRTLYRIAEENLRFGNSVLLDAPHVKEVQTQEWRTLIKNLARKTNAALIAIRCLCSEKVLHARISSRGERRDRWKLKHWNRFLAQQPIKVPIALPHLDIDTEKSLSQNINAAIRYVERQATRSFR